MIMRSFLSFSLDVGLADCMGVTSTREASTKNENALRSSMVPCQRGECGLGPAERDVFLLPNRDPTVGRGLNR
ncbi:hypothetical protein RvVAR0630_pl04430 (plasmid) [Agrobacterium vitis]|nr:hypothetical protein RvVAR0630_pl04430 [Agrobacterium vitis]